MSNLHQSSEEIWKPIINYEDYYQISNFGNVKSLGRTITVPNGGKRTFHPKILKPLNAQGYLQVILQIAGVCKTYKVHRLVAIHFIDNPNNYAEINHIDGNPLNNHITNLEWCNRSMNVKHAYDTGLAHSNTGSDHHNSKQILNTETGEIYESIAAASKKIGVDFTTLSAYINKNKNRRISEKLQFRLSKLVVHLLNSIVLPFLTIYIIYFNNHTGAGMGI